MQVSFFFAHCGAAPFLAIEDLSCNSTFEWESLRNYLKQMEMFV